jgi:hypothetical protein
MSTQPGATRSNRDRPPARWRFESVSRIRFCRCTYSSGRVTRRHQIDRREPLAGCQVRREGVQRRQGSSKVERLRDGRWGSIMPRSEPWSQPGSSIGPSDGNDPRHRTAGSHPVTGRTRSDTVLVEPLYATDVDLLDGARGELHGRSGSMSWSVRGVALRRGSGPPRAS